ncbi:flavocytochrome b2 FMN-binding domain [Pseudozyma hubeiensis SY62]|uniref:Flavocytochrome b2 FMN-binding domain n=1 Tax=Pseudozyma hubeiensis (strain SY62) TaxID=1305764 RepID=R9NVR5_PSEHS|nr:flavocytochrome b2 FMN-binding domain [Pseudozyma hubeiensis SY62]GAC92497.1 flavocytochrome b2 FMN-binding domain [Pseudozyma hubeiensis SY62]
MLSLWKTKDVNCARDQMYVMERKEDGVPLCEHRGRGAWISGAWKDAAKEIESPKRSSCFHCRPLVNSPFSHDRSRQDSVVLPALLRCRDGAYVRNRIATSKDLMHPTRQRKGSQMS